MNFQNLKYTGKDKFDSAVFTISKTRDEKSYTQILNISKKLEKKLVANNPLYKSDKYEYIKLRLSNSKKLKLQMSSIYDLENVQLRLIKKDEKKYVNIYGDLKMVKKYEPEGEVLDLDSESDSE